MDDKIITFSIIIASFNEMNDVRLSIDSALAQILKPLEILVIDDSTDKTQDIIREYESRGVRLIQGPGKGCCEAVNLGIQAARGDVIAEVDADIKLPPDYLEKLLPKYRAGADYVLIGSRSFNTEKLYARFVEAGHKLAQERSKGPDGTTAELYSEGISYRREAALAVGMFSGDYPIKFCRDWTLGEKLGKAGYKKIFDPSLVIPHKSPDTLKEYWGVRKARGHFSALLPYFLQHKALSFLCAKFIAKDIYLSLKFLLVVPAVSGVTRLMPYTERGYRDFLPFYWSYFLQELARSVGEWEGVMKIYRYKKSAL